jgi:hypothetical protein
VPTASPSGLPSSAPTAEPTSAPTRPPTSIGRIELALSATISESDPSAVTNAADPLRVGATLNGTGALARRRTLLFFNVGVPPAGQEVQTAILSLFVETVQVCPFRQRFRCLARGS